MMDLWPPELKMVQVTSPVAILREQAALLKDKTQHEVEADVELGESKIQEFIYHFYLVAPTLNNYRFRLFSVAHNVALYPVTIYVGEDIGKELLATADEHEESNILAHLESFSDTTKAEAKHILQAETEAEFVALLGKILQSKKTRDVIGALRAQIDNRYRSLFL